MINWVSFGRVEDFLNKSGATLTFDQYGVEVYLGNASDHLDIYSMIWKNGHWIPDYKELGPECKTKDIMDLFADIFDDWDKAKEEFDKMMDVEL